MTANLYNTEILRLAAETAQAVRLSDPHASVERRSPICGSRVTVDIALGDDGRVAGVGMLVRACALGQASSALLARAIVGTSPADLAAASDALAAWLAGEGDAPDWPGLILFEPARPHSARHASIRLAFEAAAEAAATAAHQRAAA
ncbi:MULTISPECIES: iron-sulfur cluster assembly scaffold protein [unclassified Sphingomonas]|uniref:iron-sulfur cluster assembly scaffold protein n=1 Tax=unclassified Sphingomonas TaxID=196159 RepID=UPI0007017CB8|nr:MULTISPECIES: iron-sulfur cluster assembly scaffold protein [unclassified Sphingomonas]KQM64723.1 nitrogen fixation protein NifU [Sphingomonas sp. Leaf16]KQN16856.1 nitrogen fixation protein NifU [Sphingomonas sp. Leaf29]KQN22837.1 nitrogen fixation protein NifU [Sphingomonas sp. Leaf32]